MWATCVYVEAVSVLPQLRMMQKAKVVEKFTAHYVFALGIARFISCAHWILQVTILAPARTHVWPEWITWLAAYERDGLLWYVLSLCSAHWYALQYLHKICGSRTFIGQAGHLLTRQAEAHEWRIGRQLMPVGA